MLLGLGSDHRPVGVIKVPLECTKDFPNIVKNMLECTRRNLETKWRESKVVDCLQWNLETKWENPKAVGAYQQEPGD